MLGRNGLQIAVCIWVSYVTSCYVTSCSVCPGSSVALGGGGEGGKGGGMAQYIITIRKQHTVNKGTRVQGNGSKYFRGVVFSYLLVYTAPHIMVFGAVAVS